MNFTNCQGDVARSRVFLHNFNIFPPTGCGSIHSVFIIIIRSFSFTLSALSHYRINSNKTRNLSENTSTIFRNITLEIIYAQVFCTLCNTWGTHLGLHFNSHLNDTYSRSSVTKIANVGTKMCTYNILITILACRFTKTLKNTFI